MIYYEGIVGSRSNNLHIPKSDYDFFCCADNKEEANYYKQQFNKPSHLIQKSKKDFLNLLLLDFPAFYGPQLYFPSEVITKTEVIDYLILNREQILYCNSNRFYQLCLYYFDYVNGIKKQTSRYVKRFALAFLYANLLKQYAQQDRSFEELFVIKGEFHQELISMRLKGEINEKLLKEYNKTLESITDLKDEYEKRQNQFYLQKVKAELQEMMHIQD